jgi:hypothetical protein
VKVLQALDEKECLAVCVDCQDNSCRLRQSATEVIEPNGLQRRLLTETGVGLGFQDLEYGLPDGRSGSCATRRLFASASRIADRRMILTGYRLADLLTRLTQIVGLTRGEHEASRGTVESLRRGPRLLADGLKRLVRRLLVSDRASKPFVFLETQVYLGTGLRAVVYFESAFQPQKGPSPLGCALQGKYGLLVRLGLSPKCTQLPL